MTRSTLSHALHRTTTRLYAEMLAWREKPDRGDVPGWVLITVMTAGLVAALWLVAEPLLRDLFSNAVSGVSGP